jgi:hypothetical protein
MEVEWLALESRPGNRLSSLRNFATPSKKLAGYHLKIDLSNSSLTIISAFDTSFFFFLVSLGGVRLIPLGTSATIGLLYQPRMINDDDYGAVGGMRIDRGNRSTRRKPSPVPLCPPQIPHDLTWDRTRAAAVESQRLNDWAMARPYVLSKHEAIVNVRHRLRLHL